MFNKLNIVKLIKTLILKKKVVNFTLVYAKYGLKCVNPIFALTSL